MATGTKREEFESQKAFISTKFAERMTVKTVFNKRQQ